MDASTRQKLEIALMAGLDIKSARDAFGVTRKDVKALRPYKGHPTGLALTAKRLGCPLSELERRIAVEYRSGTVISELVGRYNTSYRFVQEVLLKRECPIRPVGSKTGRDQFRRTMQQGAAFATPSQLNETWIKVRKVA